jgi:hypothetical protein
MAVHPPQWLFTIHYKVASDITTLAAAEETEGFVLKNKKSE